MRTPIDRPEGDYDVTLRCQVVVEPDGTTRFPRYLVSERYAVFRVEVERALTASIMSPATIDDMPVRVLMNLIFGYRCATTCPAFLLRHHGRNTRDFGFTYTSPQPVLVDDYGDDGPWHPGFSEKLSWAASDLSAEDVGGVRFVERGSVSLSYDYIEFEYENFRDLTQPSAIAGDEPLFGFGADVL